MTSSEIGELAKALAAAQGEMTAASKDATNPHFKSRYATLASVWDAIRGPLSRNGLSVSQVLETPDASPGLVAMRTILLHTSGQWIASRYVMPIADKLTPQAVGSAITYARRYALSAIVGIAPDDDDDGNAASVAPAKQTQPSPAPKPEPPKPAGQMHADLLAVLKEFNWPDTHKSEFANKLLSHYGTTLAECNKSTETSRNAAVAINLQVGKWQETSNETRAEALQTLFADIMEKAQ